MQDLGEEFFKDMKGSTWLSASWVVLWTWTLIAQWFCHGPFPTGLVFWGTRQIHTYLVLVPSHFKNDISLWFLFFILLFYSFYGGLPKWMLQVLHTIRFPKWLASWQWWMCAVFSSAQKHRWDPLSPHPSRFPVEGMAGISPRVWRERTQVGKYKPICQIQQ